MKQGLILGFIALLTVVLLAPNCSKDTEAEYTIIKELAQVWQGERYTRDGTGKLLTEEVLYLKLTAEMTYLWAYLHIVRDDTPDPSDTTAYKEEGTWEVTETEDAIIMTPEGGSPATAPFTFAGDTLVINYKEGEWRLQWTFSSRSDWW